MDFILELAKLIKATPRLCLPTPRCENSPYNSFLYQSKNCHLCYSSSFLESCLYLDTTSNDKDCVDCTYLNKSELCYECTDCAYCYNCDFCKDCKNCTDCRFCFECQGCSNCFGCVGLRKKEYHIFNKKYSREEYLEQLPELKKMPAGEVQKRLAELRADFPHPPMHTLRSENSLGDYVYDSKNCYMAFHAEKCEDCMYIYDEMADCRDCMDCTHIQNCENCYNLMSAHNCYNVDSSWWAVDSHDCQYGLCNLNCHDCFGCVNVKRKEYQILNRQYAKEEYFKKVAEIKQDLIEKGLHGKYLVMDAVELSRTL